MSSKTGCPPDQPPRRPQDRDFLHQVSPRMIALLIRGLDSRLPSIEFDAGDQDPVLTYIFDVAGMTRSFRLAVTSNVLEQVANFYPNAAVDEWRQVEQFGLQFLTYTGAKAKPEIDGGMGTRPGRRAGYALEMVRRHR